MADKKISQLTAASTPLAGTEVLPIVQSGSTVKVAVSDLTAGRAVSASSLTLTTTALTVPNGGTGQTSFTSGYVLYGNGTSGINSSIKLSFDGSNFGVGSGSPNRDVYILGGNSNGPLVVYNNTSTTNFAMSLGGSGTVNGVSTGASGTACLVTLNKDSGSGRSLNAAGTLNASGADYAEYMTKDGDFVIAKGDVCGVNAQGLLTNRFDDAVTFVVKSTNPSYVGGDGWFIEQCPDAPVLGKDATDEQKTEYKDAMIAWQNAQTAWKARMEVARAKVDRVAFSGQVPINVIGATPGQFIVPVNDNGAIKGVPVSSPTFEQYQMSVGKVIAIEPDGRARIIVKVS